MEPSPPEPPVSPLRFRCARCAHRFDKLSPGGLCWVCEGRVVEEQRERAVAPIRRTCARCGYSLDRLPDTVGCPECGYKPELAAARCATCYYVFDGLAARGQCPECGCRYDLADPGTFTRKPPFVRWRLWLPGLLTSAGAAIGTMLVCIYGFNNVASAVWVGVPLTGGVLLGYTVRCGTFVKVMLAIALFLSLLTALLLFQLAGVFCGIVLSAVFMGPILLGTVLGIILRKTMKGSRFSQAAYLPVLLAVLIPILWAWLEGSARRGVETVSTEMVMEAPPEKVWDSLMFYEEVRHEPPWILKVGLARPLRTTGQSRSVGDVKRCLYNKGAITKRITRVVPGRRLAFEVIEQEIGYERDLRLVGGSFDLEPLEGGRTRVRLTTEYEPLLAPRFEWRWGEEVAFHTLHEYVMEGMRLKAIGQEPGGG